MKFDPFSLYFLIEQEGQVVTLKHQTVDTTYDPTTATTSGGTNTAITVKGYFYSYKLDEIDGTNITKGDRKILLPVTSTTGAALPEPINDDTITGVGDEVSIVSVDKIYSGASVVCYICQVRE
jgi:hypothetical protein